MITISGVSAIVCFQLLRPFAIPTDLIMGKLIKSQSSSQIARIVTLFPPFDLSISRVRNDRRSRIHLIHPLAKESRRSSMPTTPRHVIRSLSHSPLPSLLNLSSHALIYLLLPLNLQSDNLCCFSFVLANDRGESFSALSGSMLQTLTVRQQEVESKCSFPQKQTNAISRNNNFCRRCLFFTFEVFFVME
jgi:hypothetical protein